MLVSMRRASRVLAAAAVLAALLVAPAAASAATTLRVGVGRADVTSPTGYFMMGYVRSDARITGQHARLYARAIVLQRGSTKVALVAEDLNGIPGGMLVEAANLVKDRGFSEHNVIASASHTHGAQGGYYNFGTYNAVFPTKTTPTTFSFDGDPQLYTFMVRQLALAIRRADDNLGPGKVGWGATQIIGLTDNRSIEAHLADRGILIPYGTGNATMDPLGVAATIDPDVNVLRVDKLVRRACPKPPAKKKTTKRGAGAHQSKKAAACVQTVNQPVGMWSTFANHGTVDKPTFHYFNADHHGSATRVVEDHVRSAGKVPAGQDVVNAYGNTDEGDISAGLRHSGPADADYVGRVEADAMMRAWRSAGRALSSTPTLDYRWTRICLCGQQTEGGPVADHPSFGVAELTGSEENRGPLFDIAPVPLEGQTSPVDSGAQGHKLEAFPGAILTVPKAVPLAALRIGDRVIATIPGEMTAEMGVRVRASVLGAVRGARVAAVVLSGLANEFISYFTTPEEYERQHFEGANTLYGRYSSNLIRQSLTDLAGRLVSGQPAPDPFPYDPINGLTATSGPFPTGADSASATGQPATTPRLARASLRWSGGPKGQDRPVDHAFVTIRRHVGSAWKRFTDDLALQILWKVDDNGNYTAQWEIPLDAPTGTYQFVVTGNRYRLESTPFQVVATGALAVRRLPSHGPNAVVSLDYPVAVYEQDLTFRPQSAGGGSVTFTANGRRKTVRSTSATQFVLPGAAGAPVTIAAGAATDRFGNANGQGVTLQP
jgi:hypothetical protein